MLCFSPVKRPGPLTLLSCCNRASQRWQRGKGNSFSFLSLCGEHSCNRSITSETLLLLFFCFPPLLSFQEVFEKEQEAPAPVEEANTEEAVRLSRYLNYAWF